MISSNRDAGDVARHAIEGVIQSEAAVHFDDGPPEDVDVAPGVVASQRGFAEVEAGLDVVEGMSGPSGEGQDHDTSFDPEIPGGEEIEGGWWRIYRMLLAESGESRVSVFFDRAQRPPFRKEERFEPEKVAALFSPPAWLRISPAVRYTRNLWAFLTDTGPMRSQA